jgi:biotin synthase
MSRALIRAAETALVDERRLLTTAELAALAALPDDAVPALAAAAHEVRLAWCGPTVEVEGILSAKTGGCPEDCHFCSQSSAFDTTVKATPFLDTDEVLAAARETASFGASEFCIVLAVRGPDERTMQRILELVPLVRDETGCNVAVSAGILTREQAQRLAAGGVHRYNHNLETARSFFPSVVTTHGWEERWDTCQLVLEHGMELCCGALIGMGETVEQRIELLGQLQELDPTECRSTSSTAPGHAIADPQAAPSTRRHPLDRAVPPRPAGRDPALRGRPRDHAARAPGDGPDVGHQRAHRGQLPHDARALT